ncbi:MAG: TetR/AcrR family transcriptional regulator [Solirubrobacterales bacterium]
MSGGAATAASLENPRPGTGRREANKAANRAAILDSGRQVFTEMGYGAATVRDIVKPTGLATGTFYNYFPDKESVFRELVEEIVTEARGRVRAARHEAADPVSFIADAFHAYFSYVAEEPGTAAFLRRNVGTIRAYFDDPAVGAGVNELQEDLEAAVQAGVLPAHETRLMAPMMIGAGLEIGFRILDDPGLGADEAVAFLREVYLGAYERLGAA